jgi:hypothetical protein
MNRTLTTLSLLTLATLGGCGSELRKYETGRLGIATGYNAKEVCSCLFVSGRSEDDCEEWLRVSPDIAKFKVDYETKTVTTKALGGAKSVAAFVSEREGCIRVE